MEEVSRAASRCHDGAAPVGAGCSPAPAPPPGGVCLPLPSLLRRGRRHCPSPPGPGRPPQHTRPLGLPLGGALGLRRRLRPRAGDSIFLPLSLPSRPALGPTDHPTTARPLPSTPSEASGLSREAISAARFPHPLRSRVPTLCCRARNWASVQYGCLALANASRAAHPPACPVPGTYLAALRAFLAARWSLLIHASPPLVSVSTEWRRRRCCGCEQRDPRAAESSLCKAG